MGRWLAGLAFVGLALGCWVLFSGERRNTTSASGRVEGERAEAPRPAADLAEPARSDSTLATASSSAPARQALTSEPRDDDPLADVHADALQALVIEVVDPTGAPRGGIPLRLDPNQEDVHAVPEARRSDRRGRVVFEGLLDTLARAPRPWTLRAELPFAEPPSLELDPATLMAKVVRFELAPGAPLDVVVRELDGAPAPSGSTVRLRLVRPEELHELDLAGPEWKETLADGAMHFPWVELARDWELSAWRPKGTEPTRLRARGPVLLGERVALELVLGSDHPVVSYRVLTPEGKPLANAELQLQRSSLLNAREGITVTTNAEGHFTLDAHGPFQRGGAFTVTYGRPEGGSLMGRADLPAQATEGWNDGGDIRLVPEPLLCAGRVVDERGAAVAEADVVVGTERRWFGGGSGVVRTKSDDQGRFELRGLWTSDTFEVHASAGAARSSDLEARQGADDLVLVLTARFTLAGELVLDPGLDPKAVRFALERPGAERAGVDRKGSRNVIEFRSRSVPPEHFELEPIEGGVLDLVFLLENVELTRRAGLALHSDLDLGPIDLRGRIFVCEIELVGGGDLSALSGSYDWQASGTEEHHGGSFGGPLVRILTPRTPIDVELCPRGHRLARIEQLSGKRRYELEEPLRVRLVLQTAGTLPAPPYRFDAELYLGNSGVSEPAGPRWFTPERDAIECLVSTSGPLIARWHLEKKIEGEGFGGAIGSHVLEEHWVTLDVLDVPGLQVFTLDLDADALNGVTKELGW